MKSSKDSIQLVVWGIIVVISLEKNKLSILSLMTMFAKAKEFKCMEQELKFLTFIFWKLDVFYRTSLQAHSLSTINTS